MKEINVFEYISFFFSKNENFNKGAFDAINFFDLNGSFNLLFMLLLVIVAVMGIINFIDLVHETDKTDRKDSLDKSIFNIVVAILIVFVYFISSTVNYNNYNKEISKEEYIDLAYIKDFLTKDNTNDIINTYPDRFNRGISRLIKLNSLKDNKIVKNLISKIDLATKDGYISNIEYKNITDELLLLSISHFESDDDIKKVKSNFGIDISSQEEKR